MHQTVREFFLNAHGDVARSEFQIDDKIAHICISIICVRYLMLCAANTTLPTLPQDHELWDRGHFDQYAKYLDEKPLAVYALGHLKHHIHECQHDVKVQNIISDFINGLNQIQAIYLLESWVSSSLNDTTLNGIPDAAALYFRNQTLYAAVRQSLPTATAVLLQAGVSVNGRDDEGLSPLRRAVEQGAEAVVGLLLAHNEIEADLEDVNSRRTPLSYAAEGGHKTVVEMLLFRSDVQADSRSTTDSGRTPLSYAAGKGHTAVVELLLARSEVEADSGRTNLNRTPLSYAAESGHTAVVELLLARSDVKFDSRTNSRRTPLSYAAEGGHKAVVELLLANSNLEVESQNIHRGRTPLSYAIEKGHHAIVELLRAHNNALEQQNTIFHGKHVGLEGIPLAHQRRVRRGDRGPPFHGYTKSTI
jgi:ankyrin repeat protein